MEYVTTKQQCEDAIQKSGCICSQCGGKLSAIETVDNANNPTFWGGCEDCSRFDYGVKPIVFEIAKEHVLKRNYVHYSHMGGNYGLECEKLKYWTDTQIGGATSIVSQVIYLYENVENLNVQPKNDMQCGVGKNNI